MVDACRRGKYFWLPLRDAANALMGHLGMSGQLRVLPAHTPDQRHLRVRFTFVDGDPELRFVDQRTFGALAIAPLGDDNVPVPIKHIAPDPLDPHFDEERLFAAFQRRRTGIKRALLDQAVVSGIGNIYADEALWRAFVHYAQPTDTLSVTKARDILDTVRSVLVEALGQGGTSFDTMYVNVNGDSGYFDQSLNVYGREGQPCRRCGTAVRRDPFMNRSSFTCPRCQPEPAGLVGGS
jgi:formamidopyrimidine-DNA glycosylase